MEDLLCSVAPGTRLPTGTQWKQKQHEVIASSDWIAGAYSRPGSEIATDSRLPLGDATWGWGGQISAPPPTGGFEAFPGLHLTHRNAVIPRALTHLRYGPRKSMFRHRPRHFDRLCQLSVSAVLFHFHTVQKLPLQEPLAFFCLIIHFIQKCLCLACALLGFQSRPQ